MNPSLPTLDFKAKLKISGRGTNNNIWSNWIETEQLDSTRAAVTSDGICSILTACHESDRSSSL